MDDHLKQLVKQAGGKIYIQNLMSNPVQYRESVELWNEGIEKFAKLIVEDCCNMINAQQQWNNPNDCLLVLDIKEKYGIEPNGNNIPKQN